MPTTNNLATRIVELSEADLALEDKQPGNHCSRCAIKRACAAAKLDSGKSSSKLGMTTHSHKLQRGCHIFHEGEKLEAIYIVKAGIFKSYLITDSGDERVLSFYLPGEIIGIGAFEACKHSFSAIAIQSSTICAIPLNYLLSVSRSSWLLKQACREILRERQSFLIASRKHCADARVALFLLSLSERNFSLGYSLNTFKLNIPRRDLANHLDLALETVSRVLTRLQDDGIVSLERRQVTINDSDTLHKIAGITLKHLPLDYH
jgi:CRP/FNR family transcriptional regulator